MYFTSVVYVIHWVKPVCICTCCLANNYVSYIICCISVVFYAFVISSAFLFVFFHSYALILCLWSWAASSMDCCLTGSLLLQINWWWWWLLYWNI